MLAIAGTERMSTVSVAATTRVVNAVSLKHPPNKVWAGDFFRFVFQLISFRFLCNFLFPFGRGARQLGRFLDGCGRAHFASVDRGLANGTENVVLVKPNKRIWPTRLDRWNNPALDKPSHGFRTAIEQLCDVPSF